MVKKKHFSHQHLLKFYSSEFFQDDDFHPSCDVCGREIGSSRGAYGCRDCNHYIHKSCAELPEHLKDHPFHPQHTLFLPADWNDLLSNCKCKACRYSLHRFGYRCSQCEFLLDLVCASLSPTSENRGEMMHLIDQPHPLFICDKPARYDRKCCCCNLDFSETDRKICICIECSHVLHESCASRKEIRHPFHDKHLLTLLSPPQSENDINIKCILCSMQHSDGGPYMFQCKECDFALDFWCAALVPTSKRIGFHQEVHKRHLNHKHSLIECNYIKEFRHSCSGCSRRIEDSIFVCLDCGMLLDKFCADLPLEVNHPCHTQHPFQLNQGESKCDYECLLCHAKSYSVFYYSCSCNLYLDPSCAVTNPSIIHTVLHEHPLAYFVENCNEDAYMSCNRCNNHCREYFLYCVDCRYTIHLHCYPYLPPIIKHGCHCDPLTLTYSKIKDDPDEEDDDEFYCNACEKLRDLCHPTYYCEECHFVAHPHCVFSEIQLYMEAESTRQSLGNVTIKTSSSTVDKLKESENFDIENEAKEESCSSERENLEAEEESDSSTEDELETSEFSAEEMIAAPDETITMITSKVDKMMAKVERLMAKMERLKMKNKQLNKSTTI